MIEAICRACCREALQKERLAKLDNSMGAWHEENYILCPHRPDTRYNDPCAVFLCLCRRASGRSKAVNYPFGDSEMGMKLTDFIRTIEPKQQKRLFCKCQNLFTTMCRVLNHITSLPPDVSVPLLQLWQKECVNRAKSARLPQKVENYLVCVVRDICRPVLEEQVEYLRSEREFARIPIDE
ncbi:MAG: hypothetical protein WC477_06975 [Patescibacteria group bacterium]